MKYKEKYKPQMVFILFLLVLAIGSYPLLVKTRAIILYYSIFAFIFSFLVLLLLFFVDPEKNRIVFRIDDNGVYYYKESQLFEWSDIKLISAKWCFNDDGARERGLCLITQEEEEYELIIFRYFIFWGIALFRLKKTVDYFSKGNVPLEYNSIWIWHK